MNKLTELELKAHFDLKPCTNPYHDFKFGRLMGQWQIANDCWSQLCGQHMQTQHFCYYGIKDVKGLKGYVLVIGKLKVIWGFVNAN